MRSWASVVLVCLAGSVGAVEPVAIKVSLETTFVTGPLKDGLPDFAAGINAEFGRGVTPANNAAVPLMAMFGRQWFRDDAVRARVLAPIGGRMADEGPSWFSATEFFERRPGEKADWMAANDFGELALSDPWAASADPRAGEWVAKNAPAMDAMVRASHRPRFFLPRQPRDKSTLEDLGSRLGVTVLSPMLHASRSLLVRAALAGRAGRMKEAWADVLAVHRLGRLVAEQPDVITMMTGGAIEMSAAQFTWKLVANTPLSAEQARAMQGDLAALPPMSPGARHIDWGERIFDLGITLETIQNPREEPWRPHTQKLGPNSKFQPRPEAAAWLDFLMAMLRSPRVRKSVDWDQVLRLTNANFDELVALLKLPTYADRVIAFDGLTKRADARIAAAREAQARAASRPADIGDPAPGTIVGIFESFSSFMDLGRDVLLLAGSAPDRVAMERRMSMTVLALAAYRGDKGGYPVELAALVGKYLEAMPVDFYDGRALRYRRTEKGYVLYSIGPDMVDQEGRSDKGGGYDIAVWMGQNPPGPATKPAP